MRALLTVALVLCLQAGDITGQMSKKVIVVTAQPGSRDVVLCFTPVKHFKAGQSCAYDWTVRVSGKRGSLQVAEACRELETKSSAGATSGEWYVSYGTYPLKPIYLINCHSERAWDSSLALPAEDLAAKTEEPAETSPPPSQASDSKVTERLKSLEKALAEQKGAVARLQDEIKARTKADQDLEKELAALRRQLDRLEEAHKTSCYRVDDRYQGQEEVTIAVAGSVLRFLKVQPPESAVAIGLSEAKAGELLAQAQQQSTATIFPHVFLAVPETVREVRPFFLQDRLIDPRLYAHLTGGKDANRVSHQDVSKFIAELNLRCAQRATFQLPSEEELVAAARRVYDPVANGLRPCDALRKEDLRSPVTELFGHAWQLTRSLCQPFGDSAKMSCPDNAYVRKGGAASSTDPLECLPEFRSAAPNDVNQKETSFRLALVE